MKRKSITLSLLLLPFLLFSAPKEDQYYKMTKNFSVFNSILRELNAHYVDSVDFDKLMNVGINSMLASLDPYTTYIPEKMNDDLKLMTTGEYAGIGSMIMQKDGFVVISEPYEGMPAQKNDLRSGDIILEVDGTDVKGKNSSQVSALLKGKNGTEITIKVERYGVKKPIVKKFLRENIQINPITYYTVLNDKIGYILLSDFTDKAAYEFKQAVTELVKNNQISSLIIDVRDNPGGLVDEAVKIMSYFVPKGTTIVTIKGKITETSSVYKTPTEPIFTEMNVAVLVNRGSASASEILAGAMQDLDRGIVIGERTFGKGLVQSVRPIGYDEYVKITTAKYYTPSGRCVQALDYTHRNEDGSVGRVPDSLMNEFKTSKGRIVRDGGGILPDSVTADSWKVNVAYHILAKNLYFDYATRFATHHKNINSPSNFKLTNDEFNNFVSYLMDEKKFNYTTHTATYLDQLMEIATVEGLDEIAKDELEAFLSKLVPDVRKNIEENREEIEDMLSLEIIKRYYFQKGQVEYTLKNDKELEIAKKILSERKMYEKFLSVNE